MSIMLNVRVPEAVAAEIDAAVKEGLYKNRSEAVNEALRLLVGQYKIKRAGKILRETAYGQAYNAGRKDAVNEALALVIKQDDMKELERRINKLAKKAKGKPSLTRAVIESHSEEDA